MPVLVGTKPIPVPPLQQPDSGQIQRDTVKPGDTEHISAFNIILKILRKIFSVIFYTRGRMNNSTSDIRNHIHGFDFRSRMADSGEIQRDIIWVVVVLYL